MPVSARRLQALQGAATKSGREQLQKKIVTYQKQLTRQRRAAAALSPQK
jgi:hypothetical protein